MTDTTTDTDLDIADTEIEETAPEVTEDTEGEPETFPREYVEQLRSEAADARVRAKTADDLAQRLHVALVAATGRLADPADLPYDEAHLDDADALNMAVDALLETKPHLAARKPRGNIGQGLSDPTTTVDLAGLLRARAS